MSLTGVCFQDAYVIVSEGEAVLYACEVRIVHTRMLKIVNRCSNQHAVHLVRANPNPRAKTCHYDESSDCAHVSINEIACYRTERTLMRCVDLPFLRGSVHPNSVLELTKNESGSGELSLAASLAEPVHAFVRWMTSSGIATAH